MILRAITLFNGTNVDDETPYNLVQLQSAGVLNMSVPAKDPKDRIPFKINREVDLTKDEMGNIIKVVDAIYGRVLLHYPQRDIEITYRIKVSSEGYLWLTAQRRNSSGAKVILTFRHTSEGLESAKKAYDGFRETQAKHGYQTELIVDSSVLEAASPARS